MSSDLSQLWLKKFLSVFVVALFSGSIAADPDLQQLGSDALSWARIIVKYLVRCAIIIWCLAQGFIMGRKMFNANYVLVIENRIRILDMFIQWDLKQGNHDDPARRLFQYLQSL